jgi:hypothetical protein
MDTSMEAQRILKALGYDFSTFTMAGFLQFVGEAKGREIVAIPWAMPATLFGAWISDGEEPKEYIFYRDNLSPIHQIHIQLHEVSHLLFGHPTLKINRQFIADVVEGKTLLPFAKLPQLRSPKRADFETQAETLANLIQEHVVRNSGLDELTRSISSEERLAIFMKIMGLT